MTKITLPGTGILSGEYDSDEIAKTREEERKLEAAAAQQRAEQEETLNQLEADLTKPLREELAKEIADRKLDADTLARYRETFTRFKAFCQRWGIPHLPAPPQIVVAFLASEINLGKDHIQDLARTVSRVHKTADLTDPCDDPLVRAVIRLANDGPSQMATPSN